MKDRKSGKKQENSDILVLSEIKTHLQIATVSSSKTLVVEGTHSVS